MTAELFIPEYLRTQYDYLLPNLPGFLFRVARSIGEVNAHCACDNGHGLRAPIKSYLSNAVQTLTYESGLLYHPDLTKLVKALKKAYKLEVARSKAVKRAMKNAGRS